MVSYKEHAPWLKPLLQLALLVAVGVAVYHLFSIVLYFLVAALLTLVGRPLYRLLLRLRVGKRVGMTGALAALLTLTTMVALLGGVLWTLAPLVLRQAEALLAVDPQSLATALEEPLHALTTNLSNQGIDAGQVEQELRSGLERTTRRLVESDLLNGLTGILSNLGTLLMGLFAVLFMAFFFLKQPGTLHRIFVTLVPEQQTTRMSSALEDVKHLLRRYLLGLLGQVLIVSHLLALGLWLIGYEHALLVGLFGGLVNLIPYLGPLIGSGMGMLFYLTTHMAAPFYAETLPMLGFIALVFLTVQMLDNFLLQPYLFGASVKAHPVEIFVVILIGGQLGGVGAMLLAIPVYTTLRVLARTFYPHNRFVRALYADSPARDNNPPDGSST
jgi:predicted PurR-regulated permease PerM